MASGLVSTIIEASAADAAVRKMEGLLMEGRGREALELATQAELQALAGPNLDYARCVKNRLSADPASIPTLEPLVAEVVLLYQRYWYTSFLGSISKAESESKLLIGLRSLLSLDHETGFEVADAELSRQMSARGLFVLAGRTPPFRELMIWSKQTLNTFQVALPESHRSTEVFLLDDFVSFGWAAWATCGRRATGGWATDTALYAPLPRYKAGIDGSDFRSVFLAHEAQHLTDKQHLRDLQPWELEYRAKLTELWAADDVVLADRLAKFGDSQSEDPSTPHPYANGRVVANLRIHLSMPPARASPAEIRVAARALLASDSMRRAQKVQ